MENKSSASFVPYDIRPAKQAERRIFLDVLRLAGECGSPIANYRYVGFGANRFYEFLLFHKYLGITNMVSLEKNLAMFKRAEFNRPYGFIEVVNSSSTDYLTDNSFEDDPMLFWLDYDGAISPSMVTDISTLGAKLKLDDFAFVTVSGRPPRAIMNQSTQERVEWLQDCFEDIAGNIERSDVENSTFPNAVLKILDAAFRHAFVFRKEGRLEMFLRIQYSDSCPMITMGGGLMTEEQSKVFLPRLKEMFPFLVSGKSDAYNIRMSCITEKERTLFDLASTKKRSNSKERNKLRKLGFKDDELEAYKELIRYLPRYVETFV